VAINIAKEAGAFMGVSVAYDAVGWDRFVAVLASPLAPLGRGALKERAAPAAHSRARLRILVSGTCFGDSSAARKALTQV
jgi:hypothetical protein